MAARAIRVTELEVVVRSARRSSAGWDCPLSRSLWCYALLRVASPPLVPRFLRALCGLVCVSLPEQAYSHADAALVGAGVHLGARVGRRAEGEALADVEPVIQELVDRETALEESGRVDGMKEQS